MTRTLEDLARDPHNVHFFHALRLVEAQFPDRPRLGEARRPSEDAMRFGQEAELAFPPSSIAAVSLPEGDRPGRLTNRFFGLFGPQGPLPLHLTEFARDRLRNHHDPTMVEFANILTHRLTTLFYRAWAAAQPAPSFDRGSDASFERKVAAISGHLGQEMRGRDAMPDLAKRHFAGLLGSGAKHAEGLVSIVSSFVNAPVSLQQFVGNWLALEPDDRWRLGARAGLGRATSIGARVWSRSSKFRLRIGPMGLEEYRRMLPGGTSLARVDAIVRNYIGDRLDWDVNLVLRGSEVPKPILGRSTRLGQTFWIGTRKPGRDADDLHVNPAVAREAYARSLQKGSPT